MENSDFNSDFNGDILRRMGFGEAMDALNRLVESATVGGKKEKPEPVRDEETKRQEGLRECNHRFASDVRAMYEAFEDAGFNAHEAFVLTHDFMLQMIAKK